MMVAGLFLAVAAQPFWLAAFPMSASAMSVLPSLIIHNSLSEYGVIKVKIVTII